MKKIIIADTTKMVLGIQTVEAFFKQIRQEQERLSEAKWTSCCPTKVYYELGNAFCDYVNKGIQPSCELAKKIEEFYKGENKENHFFNKNYWKEEVLSSKENLTIFCCADDAKELREMLEAPVIKSYEFWLCL